MILCKFVKMLCKEETIKQECFSIMKDLIFKSSIKTGNYYFLIKIIRQGNGDRNILSIIWGKCKANAISDP